MESKVWIYFSKTGTGYEMSGSDIISGIDAFILKEGTYLIEYCHSELINDMHFFIYQWDNSQKKRRTIFEGYQKEKILLGMLKDIDKLPLNVIEKILTMYDNSNEELELEKNANS